MNPTPLEQLLWDLDESLDAEGSLPLHTFSAWLRGQEWGITEDEITTLAQEAYDAVRQRHALRLAWVTSTDPTHGPDADPATRLDFGAHRAADTPVPEPFLALVPD